jgi:hypothetical protein
MDGNDYADDYSDNHADLHAYPNGNTDIHRD